MKLLELNLASFGGLKDRRIVLSDGINLLVGDNESGKSTLLLFIKFMFYGLPRKGHEDRERSVSRAEHRAAGSLTLSYEGQDYRIERSLVESGRSANERKAIYRLSDGAEVFRDSEPWEIFLKVPREVFESSVCIGQMRCELTEGKKGTDAIKNLLTTADEGTDMSKVVQTLERLRVTYRHKSGKGGRLSKLSAKIHEERQALEKAIADQNRMAELEQKSGTTDRQLEEIEEKLAQANRRLSYLGKIDVLRRFDALHEKERALPILDGRIEACKKNHLVCDTIPTEGDAVRLCALADSWEDGRNAKEQADRAAREAESSVDFDASRATVGKKLENGGGLDRIRTQMEGFKKKRDNAVKLGISAGVAGIAGIASGMRWEQLLVGILCLVVGMACSILAFGRAEVNQRQVKKLAEEWGSTPRELYDYLSSCSAAFARSVVFSATVAERRRAQQNAEQVWKQADERLARELKKQGWNITEVNDKAARNVAERICAFLAEYEELQHKRAILTHAMAEDRHRLSTYDETALREELADLGDLADGMDFAEAERQQKWIAEQRNQFKLRKDRADTERISLAATAQDPIALADRLAALEDEYRRAEEYCEALELTLEALNDASETMSGSVTPQLSKRAGEMMAFVSEGRYAEVRSGSELIPSLADAEGYHVDTELLSGGTRDLAYLTLRLSLMLYLFGEELPPLLMDESLCQLDDRRMGRVLTLLSRLSEGRFQCLLFSCQNREKDYCRENGVPCATVSW